MAQPPEIKDYFKCYELFRDYVKHEDELINKRLSWNLTLQGLLFAGYGFSLQVLNGEKSKPELVDHAKWLLVLFPVVGGLVGFLAWLSIRAAMIAIDGLNEKWKKALNHIHPESRDILPGLVGAGQDRAQRWGATAQFWIPLVIVFAWIIIILHGAFR